MSVGKSRRVEAVRVAGPVIAEPLFVCANCRHCHRSGLGGKWLCTVDDDAVRETARDETCKQWEDLP